MVTGSPVSATGACALWLHHERIDCTKAIKWLNRDPSRTSFSPHMAALEPSSDRSRTAGSEPSGARHGSGTWMELSFTVLQGAYGTLRALSMYCAARIVVLRKTHQLGAKYTLWCCCAVPSIKSTLMRYWADRAVLTRVPWIFARADNVSYSSMARSRLKQLRDLR